MGEVSRKATQWRCYKPRKGNDGAASKLEVKVVNKKCISKDGKTYEDREVMLFWVSTPQIGIDEKQNATFAWQDNEKTVTLKLGEADIGELLAVLSKQKTNIGSDKGVFHKNDKGNSGFSFSYNEQYKNYSIRASKKIGEKLSVVQHSITIGEACVLRVLLEEAVRLMYQWGS